ncbi:MAG: tetratricopeptide repeat protein [Gammaproteobacteria bacterium]
MRIADAYQKHYRNRCRRRRFLRPRDRTAAWPWNGLGNLLQIHIKRYEEAEQAYRKAITLDPQFAWPWNNLGDLLQYRLERDEEAEQAYWQAPVIDREFHWAKDNLLGLGDTWHRKQSYAQAESLARRMATTFPTDPAGWLLLARSLAGQMTTHVPLSAPAQTQPLLEAVQRWLETSAAQDDTADGQPDSRAVRELLRKLVSVGWTTVLREQIEQSGLRERWRPLYAALQAVEAGTSSYLSRVAPEVRNPALDILRAIAPDLMEDNA